MSFNVDTPVQCRYCGHIADDLDDAIDHAEDEHNIVTNAVLDSVECITDLPPDIEETELEHPEAPDND